jgi:hypothetical protein
VLIINVLAVEKNIQSLDGRLFLQVQLIKFSKLHVETKSK